MKKIYLIRLLLIALGLSGFAQANTATDKVVNLQCGILGEMERRDTFFSINEHNLIDYSDGIHDPKAAINEMLYDGQAYQTVGRLLYSRVLKGELLSSRNDGKVDMVFDRNVNRLALVGVIIKGF
jgi:hypothetical protein